MNRHVINVDIHFCNTLLQKEKKREGYAQGPKMEEQLKTRSFK